MSRNARHLVHVFTLILSAASARLPAAESITPSPYWKNQIVFPDDPFRGEGPVLWPPQPGWVKFTILTSQPATVYFQDCRRYPFHYHFAAEVLDPFLGMTPAEYDLVSLYRQEQQAILGAVVMPPLSGGFPLPPVIPEYGIQFVRRDPFSREQIATLFHTVRANVLTSPGVQAFYFPTYEQTATAQANRDWFASQGIAISSTARWSSGNPCYSRGWAVGELKFFPGSQIGDAYRNSQLRPSDILLTDGVPAEIPFVAGILSLQPSTPNSHVAILANSYGVPFVHLAVAEDAQKAQQLIGHITAFWISESISGQDQVRLIDLEGVLDQHDIDEILALKAPPPLAISPMAPYGHWSAPTDGLLPSDIRFFGGKAANFGILRAAIPDNSPVAVAFSFDLWNAFLDQTLAGGTTLRDEITTRLSTHTWPPADMAALSSDLAAIRELFKDTTMTTFSETLRLAVFLTLLDGRYGFDINRNLRFRSSTNVEDSEQFTGAGLYDSFSGCLADDLDADEIGPCRCDPADGGERGVLRAIRRVFASFYNENAFLERRRHGVNEHEVGMALLVHHSYPDAIELANGVATVDRGLDDGYPHHAITMVTQKGAVSVANPEGGAIAEEVRANVSRYGTSLSAVRASSLVPLGDTVLEWEDDYRQLAQLLATVAEQFGQTTSQTLFLLDLEYKKIAPTGDLVIKQVRQFPRSDEETTVTPFLINEPAYYCTYQGEVGSEERSVFAIHRLKSLWQFETRNLWLTPDNLRHSLYGHTRLYYAYGGRLFIQSGELSLWPEASYDAQFSPVWPTRPCDTTDRWRFAHLSNPRRYELLTPSVPTQTTPDNPLRTLLDFPRLELRVHYDRPVPVLDYEGLPTSTSIEAIYLWPWPQLRADDLLQERAFRDDERGIDIRTSFYWPQPPDGLVAGYTAPLVRWVETVIEGCTREPIVLRGYFSQTYGPHHHNFGENFIFEPQLEQGISDDQLNELRAQDVCLICVRPDGVIVTFGYDPLASAAKANWMLYR